MRKPRFVAEAAEWWLYLSWRQIFGYLFAIGGVLLTIYAVKVDPKDQLLIAAVAAFFQIVAALAFSSHGKADPTHARRSVQRLIKLGERVSAADAVASASFEGSATTAQRREQIGQLAAELGYIGDGIFDAVRDWVAFNEPLAELVSEDQRQELLAAAREVDEPESRSLSKVESTSDEPEQPRSSAGERVR